MDQLAHTISAHHEPWNKGKLVGQKAPLWLKEIWAIRVRLQLGERNRELALFNVAVDSKLRSCDLVKLRVRDVSHGDRIATRASVMQQKTKRPAGVWTDAASGEVDSERESRRPSGRRIESSTHASSAVG